MPPTNGATYVPDSPESSDAGWTRSEQRFGSASGAAVDRGSAEAGQKAQRGLPGWAAIGLLIAISGIGGVIDEANGSSIRGWFNWALIIASLIAILAVKRSQMFGVVIAPPLVYFVASAGMLYLRSGGLKNRKVLIDAAANWLVYGFPAIAGATAAVLLIAGVRMITRR